MTAPATRTATADVDLPNVRAMLDEMRGAPPIVQPSAFWQHFTEVNLAQLEADGFAEFKRTVNLNYFQFMLRGDPRLDQFRGMARRWLRHPEPRVLTARTERELGVTERGRLARMAMASAYAFYVAALWEFARRRDPLGLLEQLEEPPLGHPVGVRHRGRLITEDLCNSVLELTAIMEGLGGTPPGERGVIELGGGYGRLAWVFLRAFPGLRYVMVDIPPALAVAERYLTTLLPERPAFRFRRFDRYDEIAGDFQRAEIAFLTPNQLELLPPQEAGLFVNVSSLHEMRPEQITHFLGVIGRHTAGCFYTKQWLRSVNEHDGVVIRREDYPIPAGWQVLFDRQHPVQRMFFEAMYRLPGRVTS